MKILIPYDIFPGGFLTSLGKALRDSGYDVISLPPYKPSILTRVMHRLDYWNLAGLRNNMRIKKQKEFNELLLSVVQKEKPDFFFGISGGAYLPQTIKRLQEEFNIKTISYIADNPCDPRRDKYYAMSLRYYDVLLYADKIWLKILNNLASRSKKIKFLGGYEPGNFFPENIANVTQELKSKLSHDIVFTGGSYKETAEGAYRAGILGQLAEDGYDVQIWGDRGWLYREQFYPALKGRIHTNRLPYNELRLLFRLSKIYINMPSPQIFTSFQPRVFEIAAAKGFQIIDHSDELDAIFGDNYVSFKSYGELKEKIDYYLNHPEQRLEIIENMYNIVVEQYSWKEQINKVLLSI